MPLNGPVNMRPCRLPWSAAQSIVQLGEPTGGERATETARGFCQLEKSARGGIVNKNRQIFHLVLIKPTHYDDDGYPITWLMSHIPSNTLAALYGLGDDCRRRQILGADVEIVVKPYDETNTRVR